MGWLNTLIDVSSVVSEISSAQAQGQLNSLREEVRNLNRLAGEAIIEEFSNPTLAAYGMRLLAYRVDNTWLRPELFSNREDQAFTESTYRDIRKDSARMFVQLSVEEQAKVRTAEAATIEMVNSSSYIKNMKEACRIRQAQNTVRDLEARNTTFTPIKMLLIFFGAMLVISVLFSLKGSTTCVLSVIGLVGLVVFQMFYLERKKYLAAKKVIGESALKMDKYDALEAKYGSIENAQKQRLNAEAVVRKFRENSLTADIPPVTSLQENQTSGPVAPPIEGDLLVKDPTAASSSAGGDEKKVIYMCRACHKDVGKDAQYCPYCGEKIEILMYRLS